MTLSWSELASITRTHRHLLTHTHTHTDKTRWGRDREPMNRDSRWNSEAQWDMFFHGLADYVKDEIYALELPTSLDGLVSLAIRVDARLQQRGQRARRALAVNRLDHLPIPYRDADVGFAKPEPMQMGRSRLSLEEKRRWRNEGLCLYCGAAGHIAAQCPVKARTRQ